MDGLYGGDGPADVMGQALQDITEMYLEAWGRLPYPAELEGIWNFTRP